DVPRENPNYGLAIRISDVKLLDKDQKSVTTLPMGMPFSVELECRCLEDVKNVSLIVGLDSMMSAAITTVASEEDGLFFQGNKGDTISTRVHFSELILNKGRYHIRIGVRMGKQSADWLRQALAFDVSDYRDSKAVDMEPSLIGLIRSPVEWQR
ncbi:MAG TPA: Wzt carbohydrate-binding domain-containing protein, partial [Aggregatilineaceae bacterium]|nr:Wzt carbohydrate-binding domain-containing protein [Aggregatilineaceae bacterium]